MGHTVDHVDDFVVDMVLEVGSRGTDIEDLARRICLPGMEVLRTSAHGTIWLTALVTAEGEAEAIRRVRNSVMAELPDTTVGSVAAVVASVPLGDLYGRLDEVLGDEELGSIGVQELIERHMWDRADTPMQQVDVSVRELDLRTADQLDLRAARLWNSA
jgi:hypothetical protein